MPANIKMANSADDRFNALVEALVWKNPVAAADALERKVSGDYEKSLRHYKEFGNNVKILNKDEARALRLAIKKQYILENMPKIRKLLLALKHNIDVYANELDKDIEKNSENWTETLRDVYDHRRSLTDFAKNSVDSVVTDMDAAEKEGKEVPNIVENILEVAGRVQLYIRMRKQHIKLANREALIKQVYESLEREKKQKETQDDLLKKVHELQTEAKKRIGKVKRGVGFFHRRRMPILVVRTSTGLKSSVKEKVLQKLKLWGAARFIYPVSGNFIFVGQRVFFLEKDYAQKRGVSPDDVDFVEELADVKPNRDTLVPQKRNKDKKVAVVDGTYRYWIMRKKQRENIEKHIGNIISWQILDGN